VAAATGAIKRAKLHPNCGHQHQAFHNLDAYPFCHTTKSVTAGRKCLI